MSDDLRKTIYVNFSQHDTGDLLEIWRTNDRYEWSEQTFDVIREILQERHVELPQQSKPVYTEHKLRPHGVERKKRNDRSDSLKAIPLPGHTN